MSYKTSSEIQEIFELQRDDIKRLQKAGVLNPVKKGQGKASLFGDDDMSRILDIKMHMLAGYKVSQMCNFFDEAYDSDEELSKQIHMYKKRILILEYIRTLKTDIREFDKLNQNQINEFGQLYNQYVNKMSSITK